MEPIVSISLPVSLNQHRSHGPIFLLIKNFISIFPPISDTYENKLTCIVKRYTVQI